MNDIVRTAIIKANDSVTFNRYLNNELDRIQSEFGRNCIKRLHYSTVCYMQGGGSIHYSCLIEYIILI